MALDLKVPVCTSSSFSGLILFWLSPHLYGSMYAMYGSDFASCSLASGTSWWATASEHLSSIPFGGWLQRLSWLALSPALLCPLPGATMPDHPVKSRRPGGKRLAPACSPMKHSSSHVWHNIFVDHQLMATKYKDRYLPVRRLFCHRLCACRLEASYDRFVLNMAGIVLAMHGSCHVYGHRQCCRFLAAMLPRSLKRQSRRRLYPYPRFHYSNHPLVAWNRLMTLLQNCLAVSAMLRTLCSLWYEDLPNYPKVSSATGDEAHFPPPGSTGNLEMVHSPEGVWAIYQKKLI